MSLFCAWGLHIFTINYLEIARHIFSVCFFLYVILVKMVETRVVDLLTPHNCHTWKLNCFDKMFYHKLSFNALVLCLGIVFFHYQLFGDCKTHFQCVFFCSLTFLLKWLRLGLLISYLPIIIHTWKLKMKQLVESKGLWKMLVEAQPIFAKEIEIFAYRTNLMNAWV